jgi:CTP synthase
VRYLRCSSYRSFKRHLDEPRCTDHPYFVGLQAHPEFCSRPLNPSPPFLGLVAAACGAETLEEQVSIQMETYKPPHPENAMVSEAQLRNNGEPLSSEVPGLKQEP